VACTLMRVIRVQSPPAFPLFPYTTLFRSHSAVYLRGAMTVHALRLAVGDEAFFEILAAWTREYQYRNVTTEDFITLCERVAGRDLGTLFDHWLYAPVQPTHPGR